MSLDHKNVVRNNDEYFCTDCGKSWEATDRDPPECSTGNTVTVLTNGGKTMTMEEANNRLKEWREQNPQISSVWSSISPQCQQVSKKGWPTPTDPNRLLERMLVEQANAEPLTRADFATVSAWLVSEVDDTRRAMLVYAADRHSAQQYAVAVTGRTATMEVRRLGAMDKHGYGRTTYVELNPSLLKKASKAAGREVVSLITWRRQA